MKGFMKSKKAIACAVILFLLVLELAGLGIHKMWLDQQPKFHDLTVELGTESISLSDFLTEYADLKKAGFVSDPGLINLNQVGSVELTLRHGKQQETVIFTVDDTTAPTAEFAVHKEVTIDYVPVVSDFITNVYDEDEVQVFFLTEPVLPKDYSDLTVTVVAEDASGNWIRQDCVISYTWMYREVELELGQVLTKADILLDPVRDDSLIDQAAVDAVNAGGVGLFEISSTVGEKTLVCAVNVADTVGPDLQVQNVQVKLGKDVELEDFVVSCEDLAGVAEIRFATQPDTKTESKQTIVIEAVDVNGNVTAKEAVLWVATDFYPPVIRGADKSMSVEKHSEPDFLAGVTANDTKSGDCAVTVDTSKLDLTKAGTYYITYSATDESGNVATVKRKVVVEPNEEDTLALVQSIADTLSDDPEDLRDYVRNKIGYSSNWGGDDPVWYGFTKKLGNCYVHATCLKALFDAKGIESQLIWVTNKSHYWLVVKIGDTWRHIDPTPGVRHTRYSLMTDELRLKTLGGRVWEFDKWPKCE